MFKEGKIYKVKLLKDLINYGKVGDIIELKHSKRYADTGCLSVIIGHGYGDNFKVGEDIEIL